MHRPMWCYDRYAEAKEFHRRGFHVSFFFMKKRLAVGDEVLRGGDTLHPHCDAAPA
jgi:hypothetical protein